MGYPTFKFKAGDFPYGIFSELVASNGYFVGSLSIFSDEEHLSQAQAMSNLQDASILFLDEVESQLSMFSIRHNKPMTLLSALWSIPRELRQEELIIDYYQLGKEVCQPLEEHLRENNVTRSQVNEHIFRIERGGEEMVYAGPPRICEYIFGVVADQFPTRIPLDTRLQVLQKLSPQNSNFHPGGIVGGVYNFSGTNVHFYKPECVDNILDELDYYELFSSLQYSMDLQDDVYYAQTKKIQEYYEKTVPRDIYDAPLGAEQNKYSF